MGQRRRLPVRVVVEIGERDGWVCGICRDPGHSMTRTAAAGATTPSLLRPEDLVFEEVPPGEWVEAGYDPLAASVDHIIPRSAGGTDDPGNLQIAHLFCNLMKHDQPSPDPSYASARLRHRLYGTPVPSRVWQREHTPRRGTRAWRARYLMLAGRCERGDVVIEPSRLVLRYRVWLARRRWKRAHLS